VRIGGRAIIGGEREVGDHVRARAIVVLEPARTQGRRQVLRTKALLVVTIR
jgi:acetyltransferase-like isoleucine patch superfamily enzyme